MTAYTGNIIFLSINGVEVQSTFKKVSLEPSVETVDTTRGAGTKHMQRRPGLADTAFAVTLGYEVEKVQQQIRVMQPGVYTIVFGPEGAFPGKPKHVQDFILTGVPLEITVEKSEVIFDMSYEAADAPIIDMYNGGTF